MRLYISLLLVAILPGCDGTPEGRSPCVYDHDFLTDIRKANADKRTCREMFDEGNARIEMLQAELNNRSSEARDPNTLTVQRPETFGDGIDDETAK